MKIDLPRDLEQAYLAEAQARWLALDALLSEVLLARTPSPAASEMSAEEWVRKFTAWTSSHEGRKAPADALDEILADAFAWERQDYKETVAAVLESYEDVKAGRTRPASESLEELRVKHGLPS